MKKTLAVIMAIALMLCVTPAFAEETYELALITDSGTIDDKSFNQSAWEGLVQYAEENSISYKYYQPSEVTDETRSSSRLKAAPKPSSPPAICSSPPCTKRRPSIPR